MRPSGTTGEMIKFDNTILNQNPRGQGRIHMAKRAKVDLSFNFGANAPKPKAKAGTKTKKAKKKKGGRKSAWAQYVGKV
jgi:hypothetical protein